MKIRTIAMAAMLLAGMSPLGIAAQQQGPMVVPVELFACSFKEDKGWDDLDALNKEVRQMV